MDNEHEQMSRHPFFLFPEFKNKISHDTIREALALVETIIIYSKGKRLHGNEIEKISKRLNSRMVGVYLYPGGTSVLFGWSFQFKIGKVIIKPYYNRELTQLIIHYFTAKDCAKDLFDTCLIINEEEYRIKIPEIIGVAKIKTFPKDYPTLLTREVIGESIQGHSLFIKHISNVVREFALQGIICDPYASNWKFSSVENQNIIHYIDLLSSNRLPNIKKRISDLIQNLN